MSNVGFSQFLLEEMVGPLNEKQKKYITHIYRGNQYVLKSYNQFFDLFKLLFGFLHLHLEEVNLGQLLDEAISANWTEWLRWEDIATKPKIELNLSNDLPTISIDRAYMGQAISGILTLASGAIFHREDGTITLNVNREDNWVRFSVEVLGKEKFYYYDDPDNPTLFFSRSIIEMHGGQLTVYVQEEQKRLEISFTLPIEPQVE
jgi:signal transduction histidine kinase